VKRGEAAETVGHRKIFWRIAGGKRRGLAFGVTALDV
jgi:hypothetical protein